MKIRGLGQGQGETKGSYVHILQQLLALAVVAVVDRGVVVEDGGGVGARVVDVLEAVGVEGEAVLLARHVGDGHDDRDRGPLVGDLGANIPRARLLFVLDTLAFFFSRSRSTRRGTLVGLPSDVDGRRGGPVSRIVVVVDRCDNVVAHGFAVVVVVFHPGA